MGQNGTQGHQGPQGPIGTGNQGFQGPQGPGNQGFQGPQGPTGPTGSGTQGPQGPAGAGASASIYQMLMPEEGQYPASSFPQFNIQQGASITVSELLYDQTQDEYAFFKRRAVVYGGGNVTCDFDWYSLSGNTTGNVLWGAQIAAITPGDAQSVETKTFDQQSTAVGTANGTARGLVRTTVVITHLDSLANDDDFWLRLGRIGSSNLDTLVGDAACVMVTISYARA